MKRHTIVFVILLMSLLTTLVQAQTAPDPAEVKVKKLEVRLLQTQEQQIYQLREQSAAAATAAAAARGTGGGGRGGRIEAVPNTTTNLNMPTGAWWNNPNLVARLGLTDDQKTKIERAFENRRQELSTKTSLLQKEETQLATLLNSESIDKNAIFIQIDRVIQARSELERTNSAMTLEMREYLTRSQWEQLPRATQAIMYSVRPVDGSAPTPAGGGARGGRRGPGGE